MGYLTHFGWDNKFIIAPVSYTHLDVYKRQAYSRHQTLWVGLPTFFEENNVTCRLEEEKKYL